MAWVSTSRLGLFSVMLVGSVHTHHTVFQRKCALTGTRRHYLVDKEKLSPPRKEKRGLVIHVNKNVGMNWIVETIHVILHAIKGHALDVREE